ncbi:MAG: hypothetical protein SGJ20_13380 [Planctomycetota bacterium]|nr:hypothetical protein [Planctomycetota bacterium]
MATADFRSIETVPLDAPTDAMPDASPARKIAAPAKSGGKLISPAAELAGQLADANRQQLLACDYDLHGLTLQELALQSQRELLDEACHYTASYRDVSCEQRALSTAKKLPRLFLAGHQPELFHPGVWLKNFVLGRMASQQNATAINLVVDSDTIKRTSVRVPTGSIARPHLEGVLLDQPGQPIPFEQRKIIDAEMFRSFGQRVASTIAGLVPDPMIRELWPIAIDGAKHTNSLGECLAQTRHIWEGRWGCDTLEIPQSRICSLPAFLHFTAHLLAHLPRLWEVYNSALVEYRRANHIRSQAHPVPQLAQEGDWIEAPFWVYRDDAPRRQRLFARCQDEQIVLTDRQGWEATLSLSAEGSTATAIEQLQALAKSGVHMRTRALITTMVARVLLGDLFVHGIGGAKYDQLTDQLISRFFGLAAPAYMTVSGTLRLPIDYPRGSEAELRSIRQQQRELLFHPERFLEASNAAGWQSYLTEKQRWIESPNVPETAKRRCQSIRSANENMQPWLATQRGELDQAARAVAERAKAERILSSREFSFCLFPAEELKGFLAG